MGPSRIVKIKDGVLQRNGVVKLAKPISTVKVPATVTQCLPRVDRLPTAEKELLQTLAVLAREFPLKRRPRKNNKLSPAMTPMNEIASVVGNWVIPR